MQCVAHKGRVCLRRDKVPLKGKVLCCHDEIEEERELVLSLCDDIDTLPFSPLGMRLIASRLSYFTHAISPHNDPEMAEIFPLFRRFSVMLHEHTLRIVSEENLYKLILSFLHVIQQWCTHFFIKDRYLLYVKNSKESIAVDLYTIECAIGVCHIPCNKHSEVLFFEQKA